MANKRRTFNSHRVEVNLGTGSIKPAEAAAIEEPKKEEKFEVPVQETAAPKAEEPPKTEARPKMPEPEKEKSPVIGEKGILPPAAASTEKTGTATIKEKKTAGKGTKKTAEKPSKNGTGGKTRCTLTLGIPEDQYEVVQNLAYASSTSKVYHYILTEIASDRKKYWKNDDELLIAAGFRLPPPGKDPASVSVKRKKAVRTKVCYFMEEDIRPYRELLEKNGTSKGLAVLIVASADRFLRVNGYM